MSSAISLDIGSVRLTERFLGAGPPTPAAVEAAREHVDALLDSSGVDFASIGTWVGVAGTATTLAGVHLQLEAYDRERVHGSTIALTKLDELALLLSRMTVDQIKALPSMHPGRADVITAGALIAARVGARLGVDRAGGQRVRHPRRHRPPAPPRQRSRVAVYVERGALALPHPLERAVGDVEHVRRRRARWGVLSVAGGAQGAPCDSSGTVGASVRADSPAPGRQRGPASN